MKIKDLIYKAPEMSEEKLLSIIEENKAFLPTDLKNLTANEILEEFDLIADKKSYLSASRRRLINGLVGYCTTLMVKGNEPGSNDRLDNVSETEEVRDAS